MKRVTREELGDMPFEDVWDYILYLENQIGELAMPSATVEARPSEASRSQKLFDEAHRMDSLHRYEAAADLRGKALAAEIEENTAADKHAGVEQKPRCAHGAFSGGDCEDCAGGIASCPAGCLCVACTWEATPPGAKSEVEHNLLCPADGTNLKCICGAIK